MKKITLLAFALIAFVGLQAQLFNIGGFGVGYLYVGPKVGGNISTMSTEVTGTIDKKMNLGYQFGAVAKFGITKKLSIQPELIFSEKGVAAKDDALNFKAKSNYKYFGLPIIAQYAFKTIAGIQIYGSGGFYTDVLTGQTYVTKSDNGDTFSESHDDLSIYNRVDFGFNIGGGANIPFKNKDQLNIDLRFAQGVVNIDDYNTTSSSKNTSIQLSAIYLMDLTKFVNFKGKSILEEDAYEESTAPAGDSKVEPEEN
ncbi:MAG: PorT family protein [Salinivirgaceae bacterium]|nr:PorT family protein [Salinivirgaceae bacterium]